jgi:alpha-beta hydrolase superfamily lysophospholipase
MLTLSTITKNALTTIALVLIGYTAICIFYYLNQERIIFPASGIALNTELNFTIDHQELYLDTPDGARLHGVLFKAENPKGLILHFHGNAENMRFMQTAAEPFVYRNYSFLAMDYRSYGKSSGDLSEQNLFADVALVMQHLIDSGWNSSDIILYGRSIGTGIAIQLASVFQPKGMVLYAPFYNLKSLAEFHFPLLPVDHLLDYHMESAEYLREVNCPILILHGDADRIIPLKQAKRLATIKGRLVVLKNGRHNNLDGLDRFWQEIETFLAKI